MVVGAGWWLGWGGGWDWAGGGVGVGAGWVLGWGGGWGTVVGGVGWWVGVGGGVVGGGGGWGGGVVGWLGATGDDLGMTWGWSGGDLVVWGRFGNVWTKCWFGKYFTPCKLPGGMRAQSSKTYKRQWRVHRSLSDFETNRGQAVGGGTTSTRPPRARRASGSYSPSTLPEGCRRVNGPGGSQCSCKPQFARDPRLRGVLAGVTHPPPCQ